LSLPRPPLGRRVSRSDREGCDFRCEHFCLGLRVFVLTSTLALPVADRVRGNAQSVHSGAPVDEPLCRARRCRDQGRGVVGQARPPARHGRPADVPSGVVLGEDAAAIVAGCAVVADDVRRARDRVGPAVSVHDAVAVSVNAVPLGRTDQELPRGRRRPRGSRPSGRRAIQPAEVALIDLARSVFCGFRSGSPACGFRSMPFRADLDNGRASKVEGSISPGGRRGRARAFPNFAMVAPAGAAAGRQPYGLLRPRVSRGRAAATASASVSAIVATTALMTATAMDVRNPTSCQPKSPGP
jgi:hypothetical protein